MCIFLLTGCSSVITINIDDNQIIENLEIVADNQIEYNEIKNWSGFPITLYYNQALSNPFSSNEKEPGVPYYDVAFNNASTTNITGNFTFEDHVRSSIIRNCFKNYNIIIEGEKVIFSTSEGLICKFTEFDIVVVTPYKIETNNADSFNEMKNSLTWNVNNSNYINKQIYFEIDFSKDKDNQSIEENSLISDNGENNSFIIVLLIIFAVIFVIVIIIGIILYKKNRSSSKV